MTLRRMLAVSIMTSAMTATGLVAQAATEVPPCEPMTDRMAVEDRASPYDSATIRIGERAAKICYGRPSLRGRTMIGNDEYVPYDELWRTGANEPTTIHLPFAAEIAGIAVEPGSYSIYTVPSEGEWTVVVNASTSQWGHEGAYSPEVRAQEVGRATVSSERLSETIEMFTIRAEAENAGSAELVLEWQDTRVRIPVEVRG